MLETLPENAAVMRLAGTGVAAVPGEPYAIDGFQLRAHPDLEERLRQLAEGLPDATVAGIRGYPVVVDAAGVVRALAMGTSGLLLRLAAGPIRDAVLAHGGDEVGPDLGPAWVRADPWLPDVPAAEGMALLRSWLAAAVDAEPD